MSLIPIIPDILVLVPLAFVAGRGWQKHVKS
jgi:hypothetical protein